MQKSSAESKCSCARISNSILKILQLFSIFKTFINRDDQGRVKSKMYNMIGKNDGYNDSFFCITVASRDDINITITQIEIYLYTG
jgi:hypothetical protein